MNLKKLLYTICILVVIGLSPITTSSVSGKKLSTATNSNVNGLDYVPGKIIVKLNKETTLHVIQENLKLSQVSSLSEALLDKQLITARPLYNNSTDNQKEVFSILDQYYILDFPETSDIISIANDLNNTPGVDFGHGLEKA